jgi:hypothetical protein
MLPTWFVIAYPALIVIVGAIAWVFLHTKTLHEIKKLQLEITKLTDEVDKVRLEKEKLEYERDRRLSRIVAPTDEQIEEYAYDDVRLIFHTDAQHYRGGRSGTIGRVLDAFEFIKWRLPTWFVFIMLFFSATEGMRELIRIIRGFFAHIMK